MVFVDTVFCGLFTIWNSEIGLGKKSLQRCSATRRPSRTLCAVHRNFVFPKIKNVHRASSHAAIRAYLLAFNKQQSTC